MPLLSSDVIMVPPQYQHQYYQDLNEYDQSNHKERAGFMSTRLVGHDYYSVHDDEEGYINNYNCLGSDIVLIGRRPPLMAEDDQSRTTSSVNDVDGGGGSSSKDVNVRHGDDSRSWLQLGLSLGAGHHHHHHPIEPNVVDVTPTRSSLVRGPLVELDLLPSSSTSQHVMPLASSTLQYVTHHHHDYLHRAPTQQQATNYNGATSSSTSAPLFLQHHHHHHHQRTTTSSFSFPHQQEITWGPYSRPNTWNSIPSSSSLLPPSLMGSYYGRTTTTFHHPSLGLGMAGAIASDMRVIDAPQRPHSGVWFVLQASQNQSKEPFLPQIPKNYLRIKDGRITVRVLMKYVANKLRLSSESEMDDASLVKGKVYIMEVVGSTSKIKVYNYVEITCRGQQLLPYLTLQHIRDHIWNTTRREVIVTLLPHSSTTTTDHIMVLHYGRSTA
ncbi:hypothetical protein Scep_020899 [Stephania cephalantha]|uniref:Uncharacterized protein n=1 Tax=Stephania cephalantha TaxID=152367 RepID=A0AAP0I137_9MAGN